MLELASLRQCKILVLCVLCHLVGSTKTLYIEKIANATVAAYIADRLGRRIGVTLGLLILFVGVIIQVVPGVNQNMFIAGRFVLGFG